MAFVKHTPTVSNGKISDAEQNLILRGGNAPKTSVNRAAEMIQRPTAHIMPLNAASQLATHQPVSSHAMTVVQLAYVTALAKAKNTRKTTIGQTSWIGKSFGA